jgi:hypothetical protein
MVVFWVVAPCSILTVCQHASSALKKKAVCPSETLVSTYGPHSVTTQTNNINTITTMRSSNLG